MQKPVPTVQKPDTNAAAATVNQFDANYLSTILPQYKIKIESEQFKASSVQTYTVSTLTPIGTIIVNQTPQSRASCGVFPWDNRCIAPRGNFQWDFGDLKQHLLRKR